MTRSSNPVQVLFRQIRLRPFFALRQRFKEGYGVLDFRADLLAGVTVGLVALPLTMALAVASGVPPQQGLYTAIIAGFVVPLFGGSRTQVTGPTAAFVVILSPIASRFGLPGLLMAGFMAGVILLVMGLARMGQVIEFVPYPVTTGFTAGIALVIGTLQMKDFFGLKPGPLPDHYIERVRTLWAALDTVSLTEMSVGLITLGILILWPKVSRRVPALLAGLGIVTVGVAMAQHFWPGLEVATIQTRFPSSTGGGIPAGPPPFVWPWNWVGPNGVPPVISIRYIESLLPAAFAIALLGAIESLLSAVVADGMTRTRHDPDAELVALGQGNMLGAFFGGIPATGAFARTAANIRAGARSPISAMVHALFILLAVIFFGPIISKVPMAAMAALLLVVAYHMSEIHRVRQLLRIAPRSDILVLIVCFLLTVCFDMVIGVSVGIVLAALLFLRRMAGHTRGRVVAEGHAAIGRPIPKDVFVYEITGPLFFGAVENAVGSLRALGQNIKSVVLLMEDVSHLDVTALVSLESALLDILRTRRQVVLVGAGTQPLRLLRQAGLVGEGKPVHVCGTVDEALERIKSGLSLPH
ncbi:MAG: C4-dicarboxylic acid transporter DauA [Elusimicrobia bacterium]|nr:C4-dicarboxylic acid transporter DauA [Elusimicrobiota bacterium]